ncbi:MAG: class I SAM-dependent DNA methyltransferase [Nitrospirae bacterium]|nr:class I SAM-dependent DNA methyltransferase [Nitrospirota bacterium]
MTPQEFIRKWAASTLTERAASQSHFNDLCAVLGVPSPTAADPDGTWYTFEKGAAKTTGGDGWADVWMRGHFAWEYKGKKKDLRAALVQLQQYAPALENPPLLIVSDMDSFAIHTNFTNTVHETHVIPIEKLGEPENLQRLKWVFTDPERLRPGVTTQEITQKAAAGFAELAQRLRERGHEPHRVAHFLNKVLFCLFAEDAGLLPKSLFTRLLETGLKRPASLEELFRSLFAAMSKGGTFGPEFIEWFNGGLFDGDDALPLEHDEVKRLIDVARLDWSNIEPSIFGTLFERGLDPDKRSQLGAHFTDAVSIMRIVEPVVVEPLLAEWAAVKAGILAEADKSKSAKSKSAATVSWQAAVSLYRGFLQRLAGFRVLDPACGSGNFLFLALQSLKDFEQRVKLEAVEMGLEHDVLIGVGPQCVMGLELNPYAAELARVTIWIGEIQWMLRHGFSPAKDPILKDLGRISCTDAVLASDGSEPDWPVVDCIIGNPPFLGDKKMIFELGEEYTGRLRALYKGRVPGGADLVTYWFEKARASIEAGRAKRAGLVATNSIRGGANRKVLDRVRESGRLFNAWSDEPWVNEGAAVRVSLVCFEGKDGGTPIILDGQQVSEIIPDLTAGTKVTNSLDFTIAASLKENNGVTFRGMMKAGPFDIPGTLAREWLSRPNPHGRPNTDVIRPSWNGMDITQRNRDMWIIDFGIGMTEQEAALYELPFEHVVNNVKPLRETVRREGHRKNWWRFGETRPGLRKAVSDLERYVCTSEVSKHRVFIWGPIQVVPDHTLVVLARSDDTFFGIIHSRIHELWSFSNCSWIGVGNDSRYTTTSIFETFPFPPGLTPNIPASEYADAPHAKSIAQAAKRLVELRDNWLNPTEWVKRVPEIVPGYPDRILPVDDDKAKELKKRTLTNLYNQRPAWLANAHRELDEAVAAAYGWESDLPDEEVLRRLLELNLERAGS